MSELNHGDMAALSRALSHAKDERLSLADAYGGHGKVAADAMKEARRFERLHRKIFGEPTSSARNAERMAKVERISIFELTAKP